MQSSVSIAATLTHRLTHLGALNDVEARTIIDALDEQERELKWHRRRLKYINETRDLQEWQRQRLLKARPPDE